MMNVREIGLLGIMYVLECVKCLVGYSVFFKERPKKIYGMAVGGVLVILLCFSGMADETEILDTILAYNFQLLDGVDKQVFGKCKQEFEIDDVDLSAIFSNLIKNAVEAVEEQKSGNRYIYVNIEQGKKYIRFNIKNSTDRCLKYSAKGIETSKRDKKNHGIGLNSIEKKVKRNGGFFEIKIGECVFEAIVTFRCEDK